MNQPKIPHIPPKQPDPTSDPHCHYHLEQRIYAPGSMVTSMGVGNKVRQDGAWLLYRVGAPYPTLGALQANKPADKDGLYFESVYCTDPACLPTGACCFKARPNACVCVYSYICTDHGVKHVGSHD